MHILRDLFGPGTWGTGGNIVAAALLGSASALTTFLLRKVIGRKLAAVRDRVKDEIRAHLAAHVDTQLAGHHQMIRDLLERHHQDHTDLLTAQQSAIQAHITATAADAQANAGAGSNPASSEGLPADQRVVPPAAAAPVPCPDPVLCTGRQGYHHPSCPNYVRPLLRPRATRKGSRADG